MKIGAVDGTNFFCTVPEMSCTKLVYELCYVGPRRMALDECLLVTLENNLF